MGGLHGSQKQLSGGEPTFTEILARIWDLINLFDTFVLFAIQLIEQDLLRQHQSDHCFQPAHR